MADESRRALTVRDAHAKLELVERLLPSVDVPADEVGLDVELVALDADGKHALGSEAVQRLRAEGAAELLIQNNLGLVGRSSAGLEVQERHPESGDLLAVALEVQAAVHPDSGEITLSVDSTIKEVDRRTEAAQLKGELSPEHKSLSSSWRVASGESLILEVPGRFGADGKILAWAFTPTIKNASRSGAGHSMWIGTESVIQNPARAKVAEAGADEKTIAEIKAKLAARLAAEKKLRGDKPVSDEELSEEDKEVIRERLRARLKAMSVESKTAEEE